MLSFKAMAVYMIKNPQYYNENLVQELQELFEDCFGLWHVSPALDVEAIAYLGLTWDEYSQYVMYPDDFFRDLIQAHTSQTPAS